MLGDPRTCCSPLASPTLEVSIVVIENEGRIKKNSNVVNKLIGLRMKDENDEANVLKILLKTTELMLKVLEIDEKWLESRSES